MNSALPTVEPPVGDTGGAGRWLVCLPAILPSVEGALPAAHMRFKRGGLNVDEGLGEQCSDVSKSPAELTVQQAHAPAQKRRQPIGKERQVVFLDEIAPVANFHNSEFITGTASSRRVKMIEPDIHQQEQMIFPADGIRKVQILQITVPLEKIVELN